MLKPMKPYIKKLAWEDKAALISRACKICFRGKSPFIVKKTLEKWIGKLHAPFKLLPRKERIFEILVVRYINYYNQRVGVFIVVLE